MLKNRTNLFIISQLSLFANFRYFIRIPKMTMRTTRILLALALLIAAAAQGAWADDGALTVGNVRLAAPDYRTGTLDIVLSGSDLQYNDFQLDIALPTGFTYSGYEAGELLDGHNIVTSNHEGNMTRFTGLTSATKHFTAQNGTVLTISFTVADGTTLTGLTTTLSNIAFSYKDSESRSVTSHHPAGGDQPFSATAAVTLANASDNTTTITAADGYLAEVTLADRMLYKDGKWNTLCLPFNLVLAGSPLDGATARPLTEASISGTVLNLTFGDAVSTLVAGTPYIIKWESADNITSPVFSGVTIDKTTHDYDNAAADDLRVRFLGTY